MAQTGNALDVLLNALPTDLAGGLASQLSITLTASLVTSTSLSKSSLPAITSSTESPSSSTTSSLGTSTYSPVSSTSRATTSTTNTPDFQAVSAQSAQNTSSPQQAPSAAGVPAPKSAGAVAGIATGSVAAVVLILLLVLYFFRIRKRNDRRGRFAPVTASGGSGSSLLGSMRSLSRKKPARYPEAAWIYDPVRPASREGAPRQNDMEGGPRMGANLPWSSRPSTSQEADGGSPTPGMAELPGSERPHPPPPGQNTTHNLSPAMFQPPNRSRSPSQLRDFSRPTLHSDVVHHAHGDDVDEIISPLLPPPTHLSACDGRQSPYRHSPTPSMDGKPSLDRSRSPMSSPQPEGRRSFILSSRNPMKGRAV